MPKTKTIHRCQDCGATTPRWVGRCAECGAWGTLVEELEQPTSARTLTPTSAAPVPIAQVDPIGASARPTGIGELDRVLGGGLIAGSVTLLGGEPGMGKSTLLLQALGAMAEAGATCLLVTGEESAEQVRMRAERLGALSPNLLLLAETNLPAILAQAEALKPQVLAIDSIQTMHDPELPGVPGSVTQVRDGAYEIVQFAKAHGITTVLVGHVTKEGSLAGPRVLEHLVDTVLAFDGDRHHQLRMVRALKHRFGGTQELGLFDMTNDGLTEVPDPSALFLADRLADAPGSVVVPILEGARPLVVEVQALVTGTSAPMPRRAAQGLDGGRLAMLLAVLQQRADVHVSQCDVYASVAGGVRIAEAGADLAVACAIASAVTDRAMPAQTVVVGEVGLVGEIRSVPQIARRLTEAARLGFTRAVVPPGTPPVSGIELLPVASLGEALARLFG